MNHTPTRDGPLLTCSACAWRAVLTGDGRIIQTAVGDPGHDHIGQAQALRDQELAARRAYVERQMNHLRQQYGSCAKLPGSDEAMGLKLLQRLYRHVVAEHEGSL